MITQMDRTTIITATGSIAASNKGRISHTLPKMWTGSNFILVDSEPDIAYNETTTLAANTAATIITNAGSERYLILGISIGQDSANRGAVILREGNNPLWILQVGSSRAEAWFPFGILTTAGNNVSILNKSLSALGQVNTVIHYITL